MALAAATFDLVTWGRSRAADGSAAGPSAAETFNGAPAQAERAAEAILSYDYATLDADSAAAAALMTPAYADTYRKTVADLLTDAATASRGEVSARAMASGVATAEAGRVQVLVFVDQTSTTADDARPQTALNRVLLTMVWSDEAWLVDDVAAL